MEYEKPKRCTLRDRKNAADILAALDGVKERQPQHVAKVGAMSDAEVLTFLDKYTAADPGENTIIKLDGATVEEIKPGAGADADLYDTARNIINNYIIKNNWDAEKITPLQWGACMLACGRFLRSRFRCEQINGPIRGNYKAVNLEALAAAVPVWLELCIQNNKVPLICDFCDFSGVSLEYLEKNAGVTSDGVRILEKLHEIQENGLNKRILNPKENPVGAMFLQKCINGYSETKTVKYEIKTGSGTVAALPSFGGSDENI